ncbi:MAG: formate dehydrogenase accessory protein FdhE [bacterium]|nr:formate dehydrogenase accessory protein FdhE [bacterium]
MHYTFEQAEEVLHRIQKNHPEMNEIIIFYQEILKRQLQAKKNIHLSFISLAKEKSREKFEKGYPLLELSFIPDTLAAYEPLIEELIALLKERGPLVSAQMESIQQDLLQDPQVIVSLAQNYLLHNFVPIYDFGQAKELDIALLFFLIKSIVKPFAERFAEEIAATCDLSLWPKSHCPICGALPVLAYLKPKEAEGGQNQLSFRGKERFLICSLCNHCWPFPRLRCPFCQTEQPEALQYFSLESDNGYGRVDVCNLCKGYIKTIDLNHGPLAEEVLFLEDLNTIHWDLVAEKEGYCKKAKGIFSL